jgi:NAD(P)H-nitrite reductase large subunit
LDEEGEEGDGWYRRLVCRDGRLVGAVLYGDTSLSSLVRCVIEEETPLLQAAELLARVPTLAERCTAAEPGV